VGTGYLNTFTLAATGTYTVFIDPQGSYTGSVSLSVNNDADLTGAITIGGSSVPVTLVPGEKAYLTLSGTAGQPITVQFSGNTINPVAATLLDPNNNSVTSTYTGSASFSLQTSSLPSSGTYTIKIDPQGSSSGSMTVTVTTP
jgi:hypothetical protein